MLQFNRYVLSGETDDFHIRFIALVNSIIHEMHGDMKGSMDKLRELSHRYPLNDRLPAVAARLFFWGKVAWDDIKNILPAELPATFFYKQEIVGWLGERGYDPLYGARPLARVIQEFIKKYAGQVSQFTKSGAAPAKFVGQGEAARRRAPRPPLRRDGPARTGRRSALRQPRRARCQRHRA